MKRSSRSSVVVRPAIGLVFAVALLAAVAAQAGNATVPEGAWRAYVAREVQDIPPVHLAQQEPVVTPDDQEEVPPGGVELEDPTTEVEEEVEPMEEILAPANPFGHTYTMGGKS